MKKSRIPFKNLVNNLYPCIGDNVGETPIDPIYFYQDIWAYDKIRINNPVNHFDVGSHHKFIGFLSRLIPVTMVDIRPLPLKLDSITFIPGSITSLPFEDNSIFSISSLCVIEHIGLGRYGDPLDELGSEKAIAELCRVVMPGGNLYVSVPIHDSNIVYFNAHRAFDEEYFESLFLPMRAIEKKYINGKNLELKKASGFCVGLFHFVKPANQIV